MCRAADEKESHCCALFRHKSKLIGLWRIDEFMDAITSEDHVGVLAMLNIVPHSDKLGIE